VGPCAVFPSDNVWNREIYHEPVHPLSTTFVNNINASSATDSNKIHPDFGYDYGIPWTTVDNSQPNAIVNFVDWPEESDVGPYPIPTTAIVEGNSGNTCDSGGDCHVIVINTDSCILYELYNATYVGSNTWDASNGAIFDLNSNALRPAGWTSADAAGLPIFPGLVRCDEVMSGSIDHAIRFTIQRPHSGFYVYPARHATGSGTSNFPVYGARARLKADYDLSGLTGQSLVIATAMKHYGLILADIGSNWFITGESNGTCWDEDNLQQLKTIPGTAFEFVAYPATTAAVPRTMHFTTGSPSLSWSPITWAVQYEVQISRNSTMASPIHTLLSGTNSLTVSPALTDGRYYFRVRAQRADSTWGAYSVIETFTVDA
jgi:hypothetical protein